LRCVLTPPPSPPCRCCLHLRTAGQLPPPVGAQPLSSAPANNSPLAGAVIVIDQAVHLVLSDAFGCFRMPYESHTCWLQGTVRKPTSLWVSGCIRASQQHACCASLSLISSPSFLVSSHCCRCAPTPSNSTTPHPSCPTPQCNAIWGPNGCPDLNHYPPDLVRPPMFSGAAPAAGKRVRVVVGCLLLLPSATFACAFEVRWRSTHTVGAVREHACISSSMRTPPSHLLWWQTCSPGCWLLTHFPFPFVLPLWQHAGTWV
jgi:hypothetical protein